MNRTRICCLLSLTLIVASSAAGAAEVQGFRHQEGEYLDFLSGGKPVVRYMYAFDDSSPDSLHKTYKPYHHIFDPAGKDFITKGPGGRYTHHRGIFIGFSKLGHGGKSYDLWHMKNVSMVHQQFLDMRSDDRSATASTRIFWNDPDGTPLLEEIRQFTVDFSDDDAYLLADLVSTLKALRGEVQLRGDPEHAGIQYRPHDEVSGNKSARYTFPADGVSPNKNRDLPWVALTYKLGDQFYTVQQMRHPDDPSDSVWSAYRDYGRFGNYFVWTIPDGQSLTVRYRFRITLGEAPSREVLAAQYDKYLKSNAEN